MVMIQQGCEERSGSPGLSSWSILFFYLTAWERVLFMPLLNCMHEPQGFWRLTRFHLSPFIQVVRRQHPMIQAFAHQLGLPLVLLTPVEKSPLASRAFLSQGFVIQDSFATCSGFSTENEWVMWPVCPPQLHAALHGCSRATHRKNPPLFWRTWEDLSGWQWYSWMRFVFQFTQEQNCIGFAQCACERPCRCGLCTVYM